MKVLIAGVGHPNLKDLSFGQVLLPHLKKQDWAKNVELENLRFGAIIMFLITLTFVLTTPGYGFPFPSPMSGQFLLKDLMLLGAAIWTAGEALRAANWGTNRMNTDAV